MRILFWYDKNTTHPDEGKISCSVLLKGAESYFTTGIVLKESERKLHWTGNKGRFQKERKSYHADNAHLSLIESRLNEIYDGLMVLKGFEFIDAKMIADAYRFFDRPENAKLKPDREGLRLALEGKHAIAPTLLEIVEKHKKNKSRTVSPDTVTTYNTRIKNLRAFLEKAGKKQLSADEFRPMWCRRFCEYMYSEGMHVNHVARHIGFYREALDEAVTDEDIAYNPMAKFSAERDNTKDLRHLRPHEIEKLEKFDFYTATTNREYAQKLSKTRDIFLFLTYTGLHISDYLALSIDHIETRKSGLWVIKPRNKTKQKAYIKVEGKLLELWTRYGGVRGLPKMSKDDVNDNLKIIEQMCGFNVGGLSTKIGRKSAANQWLNHDTIDKDSIALKMGLKSTRHIDDYAEMTILRLENQPKKP
jgi:site-specific recombinase XerC